MFYIFLFLFYVFSTIKLIFLILLESATNNLVGVSAIKVFN